MSGCGDLWGRRRLLRELTAGGLGLSLSGPLARVLAFAGSQPALLQGRPARWGRKLENGSVQCQLCPLQCILADGEVCFCRNRANLGGELITLVDDRIAVAEVAAVEKGPLHHFLPGARALTLGAAGCNLRCLYCQNWSAAQRQPEATDTPLGPADATRWAGAESCRVVAFNYTEPTTTFEFTQAVARRAKEEGLRTYMASALSVTPEPLAELLKCLDAVVGSLKGMDPAFYQKVVGGQVTPVLDALVQIKSAGVWLEVAHLVVPTLNDKPADLHALARWVKQNLGPETPVHFARFLPEHQLRNLPPTPPATMDLAYHIAQEEGLFYPYVSNLSPHPGNHTRCPGCGETVIRRLGVRVVETRLAPGGSCLKCDRRIHGVFL